MLSRATRAEERDRSLIEDFNAAMHQYTRGKPPPLHTPSCLAAPKAKKRQRKVGTPVS